MRINFLGMIYVVEAVLPTMLERKKRPHRRHLEHGRLARDPVRTGLFGEQGGGGGLFGKPSIGAQATGDRRHDGVPGLCANPVAR